MSNTAVAETKPSFFIERGWNAYTAEQHEVWESCTSEE